jgi:hypothetical protein
MISASKESEVTAPDDEWPIHPDNEWPVRPDPEAEKAGPTLPGIYVPPDETAQADNATEQPKRQRDWKHTIKVYSVFAGIATLVFGFVYITDMFQGDEVGVIVTYLFLLAVGLLYIFIEEDHYVSPAYRMKLGEAKPRRALISDDQQPIIDMSTHEDRRDADDGSWPILQRNEPKPKFELYEPDKQSEQYDQYWPHSPLSEKSTVYEKVRRISWITGICLLWPLLISVLIRFANPDEQGLPEVQLIGAIACGFFFTIAYSEQLFVGGDH